MKIPRKPSWPGSSHPVSNSSNEPHVVSEELEDLGDHRSGGGPEGNSVSL